MAASFLGKLLVKIEGDNSDLDKSIGKSEGSVKKFSKFAVAAYAVVGVAIVAMAKKASKAASDAQEIGSKYATIFRDMKDEAEKMADNFAENFGLAGSSARELLGNTADLLTGFGLTQEAAAGVSLQTNELAADLASFSNAQGGAAAVSAALTAAYSGERESLKTYGIVINDAMVKAQLLKQANEGLTFASEQQAKIAATLTLATEQSGNAIGDVARTFESHANVVRRLEQSTKELNEEMGKSINEGLTPLLSLTDKIISKFADWVKEGNNVSKVLKNLREGGDNTEATLESLTDSLARLNAEQAAGSALGVNKRIKEEIAALEGLIAAYGIQDTFLIKAAESQLALARADTDAATKKQALLDIEKSALEKLEELKFDALSSEEQEIELLQQQIDHWATLRTEGADVQNVINELIRQRNELLTDEVELIEEVATAQDFMFDNGMVKVQAQTEAIREMNETYHTLAVDGLGAFASAFRMIGEENVTLWDAMKQAGKDAISAVLEGLAQQALVQAAISLAGFNFVSAAGYTGAAALAFAGSGLVQNLAEGGVLAPATGGVPAVMAEAGVPEMAMPLNSAATDPFADKIASRINSNTTNNTQNFNSMFSLNDENKMREAARRLFPFLRDEELRRGITV